MEITLPTIRQIKPSGTTTKKLPFSHYKQSPDHPNIEDLQYQADALSKDFEKVQQLPDKLLPRITKQVHSYITFIKNWFANKRLDRKGRHDLYPLYLLWTVTRTCNFRCDYCCDHKGNKYPDLPNKGVLDTNQGKKLLDIMRTNTPAIYYAGGEPTIRRDLPQLIRHAKNLNYYPQIINTNGSILQNLLKKESWSNFLADMDIVIVSLDSLNVDKLDKMYVYNNSTNIIRNILALRNLRKKYKFKLFINCVVQPGNIQDAIDVLNWTNDLGITFVGVPVNDGPKARKGIMDDHEYLKFVNTLLQRHKQGHKFGGSFSMDKKLYNGLPLDCRNTLKPHVDFDGRLSWPCKACVNVKPAMVNVLEHKNVDGVWAAGRKLVNPDNFQGGAANQCGANCNWAQNYSTDAYYQGIKNPSLVFRDIINFLK